MCNLYENKVSFRQLVEAFSQTRAPLLKPGTHEAPNLQPLETVRPTDLAPIIRYTDHGAALTQAVWGFTSARPKAPLVINLRSEGRRFTQGRCLVPATAFFEFTGARYPKTRWRFAPRDEPWLCLAGICRLDQGAAGAVERFALLTTGPGPDMAPYHDRQVVVVGPGDWAAWLMDADAGPDILTPAPANTLTVTQVSPAETKGGASLPLFGGHL